MTLYLASGSPRRRRLLQELGLPFEVLAGPDEERSPRPGEDPEAYALELAVAKAARAAERRPHDIVIAGDTVVAKDGHILGKPADPADAVRMLRLLRGAPHHVWSAVAVRCGPVERRGSAVALVHMRDYNESEINAYVRTGEPLDKAGAYAVQERGGALVRHVEGCYNAVVGLPLCVAADLLRSCGVTVEVPACEHRLPV